MLKKWKMWTLTMFPREIWERTRGLELCRTRRRRICSNLLLYKASPISKIRKKMETLRTILMLCKDWALIKKMKSLWTLEVSFPHIQLKLLSDPNSRTTTTTTTTIIIITTITINNKFKSKYKSRAPINPLLSMNFPQLCLMSKVLTILSKILF